MIKFVPYCKIFCELTEKRKVLEVLKRKANSYSLLQQNEKIDEINGFFPRNQTFPSEAWIEFSNTCELGGPNQIDSWTHLVFWFLIFKSVHGTCSPRCKLMVENWMKAKCWCWIAILNAYENIYNIKKYHPVRVSRYE